jgi:hypothetical protein
VTHARVTRIVTATSILRLPTGDCGSARSPRSLAPIATDHDHQAGRPYRVKITESVPEPEKNAAPGS